MTAAEDLRSKKLSSKKHKVIFHIVHVVDLNRQREDVRANKEKVKFKDNNLGR